MLFTWTSSFVLGGTNGDRNLWCVCGPLGRSVQRIPWHRWEMINCVLIMKAINTHSDILYVSYCILDWSALCSAFELLLPLLWILFDFGILALRHGTPQTTPRTHGPILISDYILCLTVHVCVACCVFVCCQCQPLSVPTQSVTSCLCQPLGLTSLTNIFTPRCCSYCRWWGRSHRE